MDSRQDQRIAIAGMGIIAPGAIGIPEFRAMVREGRSAIREVTRFDTTGLSSHKAALVEGFTPKNWIPVMKMRRMNGLSRLGVSASRMAVEDAGPGGIDLPPHEVGISIGTTFGPVDTSAEYLKEYVEKGAALAPPQLFAESVANAPGSHVAIEFGFQGFNLTFTQRESSVLTALMFASSQIAKGTTRAAISGGVEEMNEITFAVLDRIGALAHGCGASEEASRPFDRKRNGLVVGEGGAMFLLQSRTMARGRVYAWLSGFGIGRDPTASISNWGEDEQAVAAVMRAAIEDAGIPPGEIDAIWASANSSIRGDRVEYRAIQSLFGGAIPPVVASKGIFGEYAAAGGLQVASAVLAMEEQFLPPTPGFEKGEEAMTFLPQREGRPAPLRNILINTLSAGGGIACAVISRNAAP